MSESSESEVEVRRTNRGLPRKPQGYWAEFNAWWRAEYEEASNVRPSNEAVNRWHAENAERVWPDPGTRPNALDTRTHAKCMRTTESVRDYFRHYRNRNKAKAGRAGGECAATKRSTLCAVQQSNQMQTSSNTTTQTPPYTMPACNQDLLMQQYMFPSNQQCPAMPTHQQHAAMGMWTFTNQHRTSATNTPATPLCVYTPGNGPLPMQPLSPSIHSPTLHHASQSGRSYSMEWLDIYPGSTAPAIQLPAVSVPPPQYDLPAPGRFQSEARHARMARGQACGMDTSASQSHHPPADKSPAYPIITTDVLHSPSQPGPAPRWSNNPLKDRMQQGRAEEQARACHDALGPHHHELHDLQGGPTKVFRDHGATSVADAAVRQHQQGVVFMHPGAVVSSAALQQPNYSMPYQQPGTTLYQHVNTSGMPHQELDVLMQQHHREFFSAQPQQFNTEHYYQHQKTLEMQQQGQCVLQNASDSSATTFDAAGSSGQFPGSTPHSTGDISTIGAGISGSAQLTSLPCLLPGVHKHVQLALSPIVTGSGTANGNTQQPSHSSQETLLMPQLESPLSSSGPHPFLTTKPGTSPTPATASRLAHTSTPTSTPMITHTGTVAGAHQQSALGQMGLPSLRLPQSAIDRFLSADPPSPSQGAQQWLMMPAIQTFGPPVTSGAYGSGLGNSVTTIRGTPTKGSGAAAVAQRIIETAAARHVPARVGMVYSPRALQQDSSLQGFGTPAYTTPQAGVHSRPEAADESLFASIFLDGRPSWLSWDNAPAMHPVGPQPDPHVMQASLLLVDSPLTASIHTSPFVNAPGGPAASTNSAPPAAMTFMTPQLPASPTVKVLTTKGSKSDSSEPTSPTASATAHKTPAGSDNPQTVTSTAQQQALTGAVEAGSDRTPISNPTEITAAMATEVIQCDQPSATESGLWQASAAAAAVGSEGCSAGAKQLGATASVKASVDVMATDVELLAASMQLEQCKAPSPTA